VALGVSRLPVVVLLVLALALSSSVFNDGRSHDVHLVDRAKGVTDLGHSGLNIQMAFDEWVTGNCAGPGGFRDEAPLVLVASHGGGIRAAYWSASVLSDLFGDQTDTVELGSAEAPCSTSPGRAVFAMGGASGGSLGSVAWAGHTAGVIAGRSLNTGDGVAGTTGVTGSSESGEPSTTWYAQQLGHPDYLTDPFAWMLNVDLPRGLLGFGGQDRARRLEGRWERTIDGADGDFFDQIWGTGGTLPVMLLTGTQVESGCRLNVSGLASGTAAVTRRQLPPTPGPTCSRRAKRSAWTTNRSAILGASARAHAFQSARQPRP
jgi:hypothetical protein